MAEKHQGLTNLLGSLLMQHDQPLERVNPSFFMFAQELESQVCDRKLVVERISFFRKRRLNCGQRRVRSTRGALRLHRRATSYGDRVKWQGRGSEFGRLFLQVLAWSGSRGRRFGKT